MLEKVAIELKRTNYKLSHLVASGFDHLTRLRVAT